MNVVGIVDNRKGMTPNAKINVREDMKSVIDREAWEWERYI